MNVEISINQSTAEHIVVLYTDIRLESLTRKLQRLRKKELLKEWGQIKGQKSIPGIDSALMRV